MIELQTNYLNRQDNSSLPKVKPLDFFDGINFSKSEKGIWRSGIDFAKDVMGAGESYQKSKTEYDKLFASTYQLNEDNTISDNAELRKELYQEKLNELIAKQKEKSPYIADVLYDKYIDHLNRRTGTHDSEFTEEELQENRLKGVNAGRKNILAKGERDEGLISRALEAGIRNVLFRNGLDDADSEEVSALIDAYLTAENSMNTLKKRQEILGNIEKDETKDWGYGERNLGTQFNKALGSLVKGAASGVTALAGMNDDKTRFIKNYIEGTDVNLPDFFEMKDAIQKTIGKKINSLPEETEEQQQEKQKQMSEYQKLLDNDNNSLFWEETVNSLTDLAGSMWSFLGSFYLGMKGGNAIIKGGQKLKDKLINKSKLIEGIITKKQKTNPKDYEEVLRRIAENPKFWTKAKLLKDAISSKNLKYGEMILPGIKNVMGGATESAARMTLAAGISNALDLGMDEEEAWEAGTNMMFLAVGNEFFARSIGRMTRGLKMMNAANKGMYNVKNQLAATKDMEKLYMGASFIGQGISQGTMNAINGIEIGTREWWAEMAMNTVFSAREFSASYKAARMAKELRDYKDSPSADKFEDVPISPDVTPPDNAVVKVKTNEEGKQEAYYQKRIDTPGEIYTRKAREKGIDIENSTAQDIPKLFEEEISNFTPEKRQLFNDIFNKLGKDVKVKIVDDPDRFAYYDPVAKEIGISNNNEAADKLTIDVANILLEEGLHRTTTEKIKVNKSFAKIVEDLRKKFADKIDIEKAPEDIKQQLEYYLNDPHEFVALFFNSNLRNVKTYILKEVGERDPSKTFRNAVSRILNNNKTTQEVLQDVLLKMVNDEGAVKPKQEPINDETIETMPNEENSQPEASVGEFDKLADDVDIDAKTLTGEEKLKRLNEIFEDFGNPEDMDLYGSLINKPKIDSDLTKEEKSNLKLDLLETIKDYNNQYNKYYPELSPKTVQDFYVDAHNELGRDYTIQELKQMIVDKQNSLVTKAQELETIAENLEQGVVPARVSDLENTLSKFLEFNENNKIKLQDIFPEYSANKVNELYANKPIESIKEDILPRVKHLDMPDNFKDMAVDFIANTLHNTRKYPTLMLSKDNTLSSYVNNQYDGKDVRYFDGKATGWEKAKEQFNLNLPYVSTPVKELLSDLFKSDLHAMSVHEDGKSPTKVIEYLFGDLEKTEKFIKDNLRKGYFVIPRGAKELSVLYSNKLKQLSNNPEKAKQTAQMLHKFNLVHYLKSEATWGYDYENRELYNNLADIVSRAKLGNLHKKINGENIDNKDIYNENDLKFINDNPDLENLLHNKISKLYVDDVNNQIPIDYLNPMKADDILVKLNDEIVSTLTWMLDPAGKARTYSKEVDDDGNVYTSAPKSVWKYEGVLFGRSPQQLNKEPLIRKLLGADETWNDNQLKKLYKDYGIEYENGELYLKSFVASYEALPSLLQKMFAEYKVDGGSLVTNPNSTELFNVLMAKDKEYTIVKPRWYNSENGNAELFKTAFFKETIDEHTKNSSLYYSNFINNLGNNIATLTFNSSLKSGHTRNLKQVPSTLQDGSYILLNALNQPVNAITNGKIDKELYQKELGLYTKNLQDGTIEDKYLLKIPLTGDNPLNLLEVGHEIKNDNAGAFGINSVPFFHKSFDLFKSAKGQEIFNKIKKFEKNVIDDKLNQIESLMEVRNLLALDDYGKAILKFGDLNEAKKKSLGTAFLEIAKQLENVTENSTGFEFVNNYGVDNLKTLIESAVNDNGEFNPQYIFSILSINKLIANRPDRPGEQTVLHYTIKRLYEDATKIRTSGGRGTLKPDMQAEADILRLYDYFASKSNINEANNYKRLASQYISEYIDENTGQYKPYSLGVSLSKDIINKLGLKPGDKFFLKLTPTDDLHSLVPVTLTGMTTGIGEVSANAEYLTQIMGRDFDKDAIDIFRPKKNHMSKEDFADMWDYFVSQGMHTGKYKNNIDKIEKQKKLVKGNRKAINNSDLFYISKSNIPTQKGYGTQSQFVHTGQGAGIFVRNVLSQFIQDRDINVNKNKELISQLIQDSVDSYGDIPYDNVRGLIQNIIKQDETAPRNIDTKTLKVYSNYDVNQAKNLSNILRKAQENEKNILKQKDIESLGTNSWAMLKKELLTRNIQLTPIAENVRENVLMASNKNLIAKTGIMSENQFKDDYKQLKPIISQSIEVLRNLNKSIKGKEYNSIDAFKTDKVQFADMLKGLLFRNIVEKASFKENNKVIGEFEGKVLRFVNETTPQFHYGNDIIPVEQFFKDNGIVSIPQLYKSDAGRHFMNKGIQDIIEFKGFFQEDLGKTLGNIAASLAKTYADKYDKNSQLSEIASMIAFSPIETLPNKQNKGLTSLALPLPDSRNDLSSRFNTNNIDLSYVVEGMRLAGVTPKINGISPLEHMVNYTIDIGLKKIDKQQLGMPIFKKDYSKPILDELQKYTGHKNISSLTSKEYDDFIREGLKPFIESELNDRSFTDDKQKTQFVNNLVNKLTSGTIKQYENHYTNRNYQDKYAEELRQAPESTELSRKAIREQFLVSLGNIIRETNKKVSKSKWANYNYFGSNTFDMIINENSLDKRVYDATQPIYPQNTFINGKREIVKDAETGDYNITTKHFRIGDLYDRKLGTNLPIKTFASSFIDYVLPHKQINKNKDMMNSFLNSIVEQNSTNYNSINTIKNFDAEKLKNIFANLNVNRIFNNSHSQNSINYKNESLKESIAKAMRDDYVELKAEEEGINKDVLPENLIPKISVFETLTNAIEIGRMSSDYLHDLKDKIKFIEDKSQDAALKEILSKERRELSNVIDDLESNDFNKILNYYRDFGISDYKVTELVNNAVGQYEKIQQQRINLLKDFTFLKEKYQDDEGLIFGNMKTNIERFVRNGNIPNPIQILNSNVKNGKLVDYIKPKGFSDAEVISDIQKVIDLVNINENKRGLFHDYLHKINEPGFEKSWKESNGAERKLSDEVTAQKLVDVVSAYNSNNNSKLLLRKIFNEQTPYDKVFEKISVENFIDSFYSQEDLSQFGIDKPLFNYDIQNLQDKLNDVVRNANNAVSKVLSAEYLHNEDPNPIVNTIVLGQLNETIDRSKVYSQEYDRADILKMKENNSDIIEHGSNSYYIYKNNAGEYEQSVGRYLGNIKSKDKTFGIFTDLEKSNPSISIISLDNINRIVTGEAVHFTNTLMESSVKDYYNDFFEKNKSVFQDMIDGRKISKEGFEFINKETTNDFANKFLKESTYLKEDIEGFNVGKTLNNIGNTLDAARTLTTYGIGGSVVSMLAGTSMMFIEPAVGFALILTGGKKIVERGVRVFLGNRYGVLGGVMSGAGYSKEGMGLIANSFGTLFSGMKDIILNKGERYTDESKAQLAALFEAEKRNIEFNDLVQHNDKIEHISSLDYFREKKQFNKIKPLLEQIQNNINQRYASSEATRMALLEEFERIQNKLTKKGFEIIQQGNDVYVNYTTKKGKKIEGQHINELLSNDFGIMSSLMYMTTLNGLFQKTEEQSVINALALGYNNIERFEEIYKKVENEKVKIPELLKQHYLQEFAGLSKGFYDKTINQRSIVGRQLIKFSQFGKETSMKILNYDRELGKAFKEYNSYLKERPDYENYKKYVSDINGVPFSELTLKSGNRNLYTNFILRGITLAALGLIYEEFQRGINKGQNPLAGLAYQFGLPMIAIDGANAAMAAAYELFIKEPTARNSKLGNTTGKALNDFTRNLGGLDMNEISETFIGLANYGWWSAYAYTSEEKRAVNNYGEDLLRKSGASMLNRALPIGKSNYKTLLEQIE
jgi:hypothetical protein